MRAKSIIGAILFLIAFTECKKHTVIVVTEACVTANKSIVHVGDTVLYTNCSKADYATIGFKLKGTRLNTLSPYYFDSQNHYLKIFTDTGTFLAIVQPYMRSGNYTCNIDSSVYVRVNP